MYESAAASATLFAVERVSYLLEETICSPRNVVNETVKVHEAHKLEHALFPWRLEKSWRKWSGALLSRRPSIGDPLTLFRSHPAVADALQSVWSRRRIDYHV